MSIAKKMNAPAIITAFAVALAGCASTPPENPRLSRAEATLRSAYNDKYVAEYGHADLARAETSLATARIANGKRHEAETAHELTMAEGYTTLGTIHGAQEHSKADTAALKDRQDHIRLAARDRDVNRANDRADASHTAAMTANAATEDANLRADMSRADAANANAATQNANDRADASNANAVAAQAATQSAQDKINAMRTQLNVYDMRFSDLGATLVLRDVMFDTNSSTLRAGAVNRLDPLIAYLHANPTTTVRIEGHTDSTGTVERNNTLSLGRADSVKRSLQANGTVANTITTVGYGEEKPIASNATVSGREQNRRVEITLQ
jgi:outer membrane protein OmpA-like peptidoglycan-associated protein